MDYLYQLLATFIAVILVKMIPEYVFKYFGKKGENLATKEDIGAITREIESVKTEIALANSVEESKRAIKHEACLEALSIVDAFLSYNLIGDIDKQEMETRKTREAHNKLILACDDPRIVDAFFTLIFGLSSPNNLPPQPLTDQLNRFRNLIRQELGFGEHLELDRTLAWIGKTNFNTNVLHSASPEISTHG